MSSYSGKRLVLVDGSSLAFRSFFALFTSGLRTKSGTPTWAVLGFFNSLFDLIERYTPEMLAVCFDLKAPTFRHEEFAEYKANRNEMPDDLAVQWPLLKQGVEVLGLPIYELAGYEADDVIGTLARIAENSDMQVLILTGDQDAFQLVNEKDQRVKILMPTKAGLQLFGREEVFEKVGVWPEQIVDYKGLCGDTSDNIPGIKGIGPKTAVQLLTSYQSIEGIYDNIELVTAKALKQKLIEGEPAAKASKRLATIRLDVPVQFDFDHCHLTPPNLEAVSNFFGELEFKGLVKRLPKVFENFRQAVGQESAKVTVSVSMLHEEGAKRTVETMQAQYEESMPRQLDLLSLVPEKSIDIPERFGYLIVDSQHKLESLVTKIRECGLVAVAIQMIGEQAIYSNIAGLAFALPRGQFSKKGEYIELKNGNGSGSHTTELFYVPIASSSNMLAQETLDALKPVLADPGIAKIVHNGKAVSNAFYAQDIKFEGIVFDTMLANYIIHPDEKHNLRDQAQRILDYVPLRTGETGTGRKQLAYEKMSLEAAAEYGSDEARLLVLLTEKYLHSLDADQKFLLEEMELPLSCVLAKMEQVGVALDLPFLGEFSQQLNTEIALLESSIYALAGHGFNINSTQQLQKVLFEEIGLKTKSRTKTGYSTDASVLEALREEHEIIPKLLDYRQLTKLRSTYVDALPKLIAKRDKRVHGEFNQAATSTGRLSSSNPNLQNIPIRSEIGSRMRNAFVPSEADSVIISADYSQIELRLLAHMAEDPTLIDAFEKNQDVHARTAGEIFDIPIEEVSAEMRRVGKTLNFALIYQQGAFATAQDLKVSTKEAAKFIEKYFSRYANVRQFLDSTIQNARNTGYVETLWKRRRYFKFINDRNDALRKAEERAACNAPIQGSAADLMKLAMIRLDKELHANKLSAKLILQVHDELLLEVSSRELEATKKVVVEAMLLGQPFKVPLRVDLGVGKSWMDAK
jgi:DNA polymerase I